MQSLEYTWSEPTRMPCGCKYLGIAPNGLELHIFGSDEYGFGWFISDPQGHRDFQSSFSIGEHHRFRKAMDAAFSVENYYRRENPNAPMPAEPQVRLPDDFVPGGGRFEAEAGRPKYDFDNSSLAKAIREAQDLLRQRADEAKDAAIWNVGFTDPRFVSLSTPPGPNTWKSLFEKYPKAAPGQGIQWRDYDVPLPLPDITLPTVPPTTFKLNYEARPQWPEEPMSPAQMDSLYQAMRERLDAQLRGGYAPGGLFDITNPFAPESKNYKTWEQRYGKDSKGGQST